MSEIKAGDRVRVLCGVYEGRQGVVQSDILLCAQWPVMLDDSSRLHFFLPEYLVVLPVEESAAVESDIVSTTFGPLDKIAPEHNSDTNVKESGQEGSGTLRATEIAAKASNLVGGDRDRQHGAKHDNFSRIANMWNAWLKTRRDPDAALDAHDVGIMMVLMKAARTQSGALNLDDYVDACGYAACAGEVAQTTATA